MDIGVIGINHRSSPLDLRETLSRIFHRKFKEQKTSFAKVLLSTCNRTELYFSSSDYSKILKKLQLECKPAFEPHFYTYFGKDCFMHLAKVTAGMDSAIFGESEVQGQVKLSYAAAKTHQKLPSTLHYLFQKSIKIGKEVRTSFFMPKQKIHLSEHLLSLVKQLQKNSPKILFVGNSAINRRIRQIFHNYDVTLCTRMDIISDGKVINWNQLNTWNQYDVIIFGTNHYEYVLKGRDIQTVLEKSLIFDLGVPRNVDPILDVHPKITLYNLDEISQMMENSIKDSALKQMELKNLIEMKSERAITLYEEKQRNKERFCSSLVGCT
ncbi:MAG: hypothetical protein KAR79_01050 [Simkaniaceae bacterium]|nr:hypothetical protein [Simkaniaceae bacterium]